MSGTPYVRFFGDDWLSGTLDLDLQERGALITIVALTASTGKPPTADYNRLARRFGCTPGKAKKMVAVLVDLGKVTLENGTVNNARALKEAGISSINSKKQSENASARWAKKDKKSNENKDGADAVAMPAHMPNTCQPEPEPEPYKEGSKEPLSLAPLTDFPDETSIAVRMFKEAAEENGWPVPRVLSKSRRSALKARLKELDGIEGWKIALEKAAASSHCNGGNDRGWRLSFDFITSQSGLSKLMEGNYDDRSNGNRGGNANNSGIGSGTAKAFAAVAKRYRDGAGPAFDGDAF